MTFYRPTWAEISKSAFLENVRSLKKYVGPKVDIMAVLKADGYGHGASALAPLAIKGGASILGVSSLEEGISLREDGVRSPIFVLGGLYPLINFAVALDYDLIPTVASFESATAFAEVAKKKKKKGVCHLKVDTGMGRIGVSVDEAKRILEWAKNQNHISISGVYSHFSSADTDKKFTQGQMKKFSSLIPIGNSNPKTQFHFANSAAVINFQDSHLDMIRPGLLLYGSSLVPVPASLKISPVLSWHTRVIFLKKVPKGTPISYGKTFITKRESLIATLPVGYADGVPRSLSNKGEVIVKGERRPIVGRVTMDQIMVDVTGLDATVGDPIVLIGSEGTVTVSAEDWANWAGTVAYEIYCGISKRVPRRLVA